MKKVREDLCFLAKSQGHFCQEVHINPVHSLLKFLYDFVTCINQICVRKETVLGIG